MVGGTCIHCRRIPSSRGARLPIRSAMKLAFLGTSEFAVPALHGAGRCRPRRGRRLHPRAQARRPRPAGAPHAGARPGARARPAGAHAEKPPKRGRSAGLQGARSRCRRGRRPTATSCPRAFLDAPVLGCINIHGSLLPRWRGAAPIHRAILAGDAETGVTTMRMDEGLDTGPMLLAERTPISAADTAETVHDRLAELGAPADRVDARRAGRQDASSRCRSPRRASPTPTSSARRKARSTGGGPAAELERKVRAFHPWPGTWFDVQAASASRCWPPALALAGGAPGTVSVGTRRLSGRGLRRRRPAGS